MGTVLLHFPGGVGKVHGGLLIPMKVTNRVTRFGNKSSGHDSLEINYLVTDGSLTTDGGSQ